jgi:hypothetical protein
MYTFSTKGLSLYVWKLKIWYFYVSGISYISRRYKTLVNASFMVRILVHLNDNVAIGLGIIFIFFLIAVGHNILLFCAERAHLSFLVSQI